MLKLFLYVIVFGFICIKFSQAGNDHLPLNSRLEGTQVFQDTPYEKGSLRDTVNAQRHSKVKRFTQRSETIDLTDEDKSYEHGLTIQNQDNSNVNSLTSHSCLNQREQFQITRSWMESIQETIKTQEIQQLGRLPRRSKSISIDLTEEWELANKDAIALNGYFSGLIKYGTFVPPIETDENQEPKPEVLERWIEFQSQQSSLSEICNPTTITNSTRCKNAIDVLRASNTYKEGENIILSILGRSDSPSSPRSLVTLIARKISEEFNLAQEYKELMKQNELNRTKLKGLKNQAIIQQYYKDQLEISKKNIYQLIKDQNKKNKNFLESRAVKQQFGLAFEAFLDSIKFFNPSEEDSIKSLFSTFLKNYYQANDLSIKRDLFHGLLSNYPQALSKESFKSVLVSAGPVLHKFFQFLGET